MGGYIYFYSQSVWAQEHPCSPHPCHNADVQAAACVAGFCGPYYVPVRANVKTFLQNTKKTGFRHPPAELRSARPLFSDATPPQRFYLLHHHLTNLKSLNPSPFQQHGHSADVWTKGKQKVVRRRNEKTKDRRTTGCSCSAYPFPAHTTAAGATAVEARSSGNG